MNCCTECGRSVEFGSGWYVNRVPSDDGYMCAECASLECDRCDQTIPLDEDITPNDVYGWDDDAPVMFYDFAHRICECCLTTEERKLYTLQCS